MHLAELEIRYKQPAKSDGSAAAIGSNAHPYRLSCKMENLNSWMIEDTYYYMRNDTTIMLGGKHTAGSAPHGFKSADISVIVARWCA